MPRTSRPDRPSSSTRTLRRGRLALAGLMAAGMAIVGLAFAAPAQAKTGFPDLEVTSISDCGYDSQGELGFAVWDLLPSDVYDVTLTTAAGGAVQAWTFQGVHDGSATIGLAPGDYRLALSVRVGDSQSDLMDEATFTIGACLDLNLDLIDPTCSTGDDGVITLVLSGLIVGESYDWWAGGFNGTFVAETDSVAIPLSSGSPPGNFIAYVQTTDDSPVYDWRAFSIEPCQPDLVVTVTQCTVIAGTGTVDVALSKLVHGVVYTVTGPDGSTQQATAQPSGVTELTFTGLKAGATYDVSVAGAWTVDEPYEEPPYIGGGDFAPLDTVELAASAEFTLVPCPVAAATSTPGLAATGVDGVGPLVAAAIVFLGVGCAAVLAARRRRPAGSVAD